MQVIKYAYTIYIYIYIYILVSLQNNNHEDGKVWRTYTLLLPLLMMIKI